MDFTDLTEALSRALSRGGVPVDSLDETG
jgi:hypothetical protein